jgi:prepilin-type N-terminal cleavage/methylation domain-containing protein
MTEDLKFKKLRRGSRLPAGFTLLEMIVSLGVFSAAILIILGAILSINDAQKKMINIQAVEDNLRFALDTMSREIRTGSVYNCEGGGSASDCPAGSPIFAFDSISGGRIIYRWNSVNKSIEESEDNGSTYYPITGNDLKIEKLTFYVFGTGTIDFKQPRVTMIIKAFAGEERIKTRSEFNIQTTVTQRELDS